MITTASIRSALASTIAALEASEDVALFEEVTTTAQADLSAALDHLRRHQTSLVIIAPGEDEWEHHTLPDENVPLRSEVRNRFELLITARDLDMDEDGVADCAALKDALCEALLWATLGLDGLLILPLSAEPVILESDDNRRGREAWRVTIEARQSTTT